MRYIKRPLNLVTNPARSLFTSKTLNIMSSNGTDSANGTNGADGPSLSPEPELSMKVIKIAGTPYNMGYQHGQAVPQLVKGTLDFYKAFLTSWSGLSWTEIQQHANGFVPYLQREWPDFYAEMEGIASGSEQHVVDIVCLNVRTEVAFGLSKAFKKGASTAPEAASDGCTSLAWAKDGRSILAQNWDWMAPQRNLVVLQGTPDNLPRFFSCTEAGIIGKIGFNEYGVGVLLNAIAAKGVDPTKTPVHVALRNALQFKTTAEVVKDFRLKGIAAAAHILVSDASGDAEGVESSAFDIEVCEKDNIGAVVHSNHYLKEHKDVEHFMFLQCSPDRVERIDTLVHDLATSGAEPTIDNVQALFSDTEGEPKSICKPVQTTSLEKSTTLFNITMDLVTKKAKLIVGRPVDPEGEIDLAFE